jgi:hypothetical protein
MAPETSWGQDTVRLGAADPAAPEAKEDVNSEAATESAKDTGLREDANWGIETVVLGGDRAGRAEGSVRVSRRESARHRAFVAAAAAVAVTVLAIAAMTLVDGGGDRRPQPAGPRLMGGAAHRSPELEMRVREELRRRAERRAKAAHIARERRRLRERRHRQRKAAREKMRAASEPAPVSEQAPEYVPEDASEAAPEPEPTPPPAASPTPPGVEFGM